MTRDSIYQQLRSHLAYLNLTAAAEALPAALDGATKTKQAHAAFLEQLLRVEVDATEARRHAGRLRFANLPAPWRIEDFDFTANRASMKHSSVTSRRAATPTTPPTCC